MGMHLRAYKTLQMTPKTLSHDIRIFQVKFMTFALRMQRQQQLISFSMWNLNDFFSVTSPFSRAIHIPMVLRAYAIHECTQVHTTEWVCFVTVCRIRQPIEETWLWHNASPGPQPNYLTNVVTVAKVRGHRSMCNAIKMPRIWSYLIVINAIEMHHASILYALHLNLS